MTLLTALIGRVVLALIAAAGILPAAPAAAATTGPAVYVENHAASVWPVTSAGSFVDRYTRSHIVYVRHCPAGARCIRIYEKTVRSEYAAITYPGSPVTTIYLNPQRRGYSYARRIRIVAHELGHAFGIINHSPYCTNVMYARTSCPNGTLPPYAFTSGQRTILGRS